ncbi:MAG: transposase family protein [Christensenellales bacterium]
MLNELKNKRQRLLKKHQKERECEWRIYYQKVMKIRFVLKKLEEVQDQLQLWKIRHSLVDILAISIVAIMCGAQSSHQIRLFAQVHKKHSSIVFYHCPMGYLTDWPSAVCLVLLILSSFVWCSHK